MQIAIVNDAMMTLEFLKQIVEKSGIHEVLWTAKDGREAVEKCAKATPDVLLMDLIMPVLDGVRATEEIMKSSPCAILIVTASIGGNAAKVFEAMGFGALDVVRTPSIGHKNQIQGAELLKKIDVIGRYLGVSSARLKKPIQLPAVRREASCQLLVIGASTGGPHALAKLLSGFTADTPFGIVVIQHVDEQFAEGLAAWLGRQIQLPVSLAREGEWPAQGRVLVAGLDKHLVLTTSLTLHYQEEPIDIAYRPSVDVFFQSIAEFWPAESVAVLLTGMGRDGAFGLKALRDKGWHTIAQDQQSCIVFGMPRAAIELGAASEVLPLEGISLAIIKRLQMPFSQGS